MVMRRFILPNQKCFTWAICFSLACFPQYIQKVAAMLNNWLFRLDKLLQQFPSDAHVVPGHGDLATMKDLANMLPC
jgi:hypothetical protein